MNRRWVAWWLFRHVSNYQNMLSTITRNVFWTVWTVFKDNRLYFRKKFISLLVISSIWCNTWTLPSSKYLEGKWYFLLFLCQICKVLPYLKPVKPILSIHSIDTIFLWPNFLHNVFQEYNTIQYSAMEMRCNARAMHCNEIKIQYNRIE